LLYRQWVEDNRAYVARISNNRLGYVHIPDMSSNSLSQLYVDLDVENEGKQGVVVDIRNNNGGFVNPYAIDVLSRRGYLNFQVRDQWTTPARSSLGQRSLERPTILVRLSSLKTRKNRRRAHSWLDCFYFKCSAFRRYDFSYSVRQSYR
jgi:hypothetical protein